MNIFVQQLALNHLTYLLAFILSSPVAAKTVEAETDPPLATNQATSITFLQTTLQTIQQIVEDSRSTTAVERVHPDPDSFSEQFPPTPAQTRETSPQAPGHVRGKLVSQTVGGNFSPVHSCTSICDRTLKLPSSRKVENAQPEKVPRTLNEAGFPGEPIFATPNPISQTLPKTPATPPDTPTPNLQVSPRVGGSFTTGPGVGYDSSFGGIEGFVPLSQSPGRNIAFLQGRALLTTENARLGGNVVVGYRGYNRKNNRILGGYLGYDIRNTGNSTFHQVGVGVESLGDFFDVRANGYIPVGNIRRQIGESIFNSSSFTPQAPNFQGNYLALGSLTQLTQINHRFEAAMSGFDAEAGVRIARFGETGDLRSYGGLYYYNAPGTASIVGVRGRIELRPTDNFRVGLSVERDGKFGTNVVLSVGTNFPGTSPRGIRRQDEVVARLGEGVSRQEFIVVDQQRESQVTSSTSNVVATNPATNQPYLFQHVNLGEAGGNGTFENPFGIVQNALDATRSDGNDIVYVQPGTNPGIPAFTIPDKVQVLSTGPVQVIPTVELGNVQLPLSGAGVLPTILPSSQVNVPSVTMGNSTVLSGFIINNATDVGIGNEGSAGTGLNPISNVTIRDNQITQAGAEGIRLGNVTGEVNILNNTITNSGVLPVGGDGIQIANTGGQVNPAISGNTISDNNGAGILFNSANSTNSQVTATISENTILRNNDAGIFFNSVNSNNSQITAAISGNNISEQSATGILFSLLNSTNSLATATIAGNTISGNGTKATISNSTLAGNGANRDGKDGSGISFFLSGNNPQATTEISGNNQILNNNSAGIYFSLDDNAQATSTISGNTISGNFFNGIGFDLNLNSGNNARVNNANFSENTISGNGIRANNNNGNGIGFNFYQNASADNITISENPQISNNNGAGINFELFNDSQVTATISRNTISGNIFYAASLGNNLVPSGGNGIAMDTFDRSTLRLLIDSNLNISNNQTSGIFLQINNGSNLFATVRNNTLTNNKTNPVAGSSYSAIGNFTVQSNGNSKVCLNLANNTSIASNPPGSDFNFFIGLGTPAQFIYSATGNTPAIINFFYFVSSRPPAPPSLFTTPLGSCPVP